MPVRADAIHCCLNIDDSWSEPSVNLKDFLSNEHEINYVSKSFDLLPLREYNTNPNTKKFKKLTRQSINNKKALNERGITTLNINASRAVPESGPRLLRHFL